MNVVTPAIVSRPSVVPLSENLKYRSSQLPCDGCAYSDMAASSRT
jgi:hypothetical protein